jgi:hypothetical protein
MRLLTHEWLQPNAAIHQIYSAKPITAGISDSLLSTFAAKRPDGKWSVLLVNRDAERSRRVRLRLSGALHERPPASAIVGLHDEWLFSRAQYRWRADGANGHPDPDRPPLHRITRSDVIVLPPYSMAVVRGSP